MLDKSTPSPSLKRVALCKRVPQSSEAYHPPLSPDPGFQWAFPIVVGHWLETDGWVPPLNLAGWGCGSLEGFSLGLAGWYSVLPLWLCVGFSPYPAGWGTIVTAAAIVWAELSSWPSLLVVLSAAATVVGGSLPPDQLAEAYRSSCHGSG